MPEIVRTPFSSSVHVRFSPQVPELLSGGSVGSVGSVGAAVSVGSLGSVGAAVSVGSLGSVEPFIYAQH